MRWSCKLDLSTSRYDYKTWLSNVLDIWSSRLSKMSKNGQFSILSFSNDTVSPINLMSVGNSMICSDIWYNYHEWYFKVVYHTFGTILKYYEWYLWRISRTIHAITCLYYNPCVYFRRVVSLRRRANWFRSSCFRPSWSRHWARLMYFSQYFGLIDWFSDLLVS